MGILYNSVKLHQRMKHKMLLDRFLERNITHTPDGRDLSNLSYDDLKIEAVLQSFRDIDTEKDESKWF